jgi:diacylglycerol kinase family enzyme
LALVDDGLFDLLLSSKMSRFGILRMIPLFLQGTHFQKSRAVQLARARHVLIDVDGTLPAHVDGEVYGLTSHHYEFTILPARLQVFSDNEG